MSAATGVLVFLFLRAWWRPIEDRPRVVMRMRAERRRCGDCRSLVSASCR